MASKRIGRRLARDSESLPDEQDSGSSQSYTNSQDPRARLPGTAIDTTVGTSSSSSLISSRESSVSPDAKYSSSAFRQASEFSIKTDTSSSSHTGYDGQARDHQQQGLLPAVEKFFLAPQPFPVVPLDGRPENFGTIHNGLYRSSYPRPEDYPFMLKTGVKTVITLGQKDEPDDAYNSFLVANSIKHHIIQMKGTKKQSIPLNIINDILAIARDKSQYPLLIHCNHGKHRTGCVVAVIRLASKWTVEMALDEYKAYAAPKIRDCDVSYITEFKIADLSQPDPAHEVISAIRRHPLFPFAMFASAVLMVWICSGWLFSLSE